MDQLKFYRPYTSDSEYDSESDGSTRSSRSSRSSSVFENEVPNFVQLAQNLLSNTSIAGPDLSDISGQVFFMKDRKFALYNSYDTITESISSSLFLHNFSNTLTAQRTHTTSIINLDSQDRDKSVYPQPTNLQLRLPRTYRNVQNFQIVQIKLLSAFYYFRKSKQNISIPINEQNRYLDKNGNVISDINSIVDPNFEKTLNIITTKIREGSYTIDTLINELNTQLNVVPLFYDFINGFNDFVPLFASTGDFSVNFNLPGDYYYNSLLNEFIPNPTVDQIVRNYFQSRYAGQTSYTINQIKIAYYYPIIKELLLDDNYTGTPINFTNIDSTVLLPGETPYSRCVYYFQGLNDNYILNVIINNVTVLDAYRIRHTFRYSLINKYEVSYNTFNNYISIATPSLNTSLVNLLNQQQLLYFNQQLNSNAITSNQYNDLFTQNTLLLALLNDMYNYLQTSFASGFAIEYNTFSLDYYGIMNNYVYLRNGSNAVISSNYDINIITNNKAPISNNIISNYQQSNIANWSNLYNNPSSNFSSATNLYYFNNNPFNLQSDSIETYHTIIDSNDTIYSSKLLNHVDTIANINNTSYSILKFKSNFRQSLQVETLPRPTKYRYQEYNSNNYSSQIQDYFNNKYSYEYNQSNSILSNTNIIINRLPTFKTNSTTDFGISYSNSLTLWNSSNTSISGTIAENYYTFIPPLPSNTQNTYRYRLGLTIDAYPLGTNFNNTLDMFVYRDAGAFYADILSNRTELKYNYLCSNTILTSVSSQTIEFTTYTPTQYYIIVRSQTTTPTVVNFTLTPYCVNGMSNTLMSTSLVNFNPLADPIQNSNNLLYARSYDSNYLALPNYSNLFQQTPVSNTLFPDISYNDIPIGYDTNRVSTDLTSYIGYSFNQPLSNNVPNSTYRVDPISGYIFRNQTGYNSTTQTYLYTNSSNKLFTPQLVSDYSPTTVSEKQYLQVHYYGTQFLSNSKNQPPLEPTFITTNVAPFNSNTLTNVLTGYTFDTNGNLTLGNGVYGLSLIPSQGTWDIQKYMIKSIFNQTTWVQSNIYNYTSDPNLNIKYLGIFYNTTIYNKELSNISLQNAIVKLNLTTYTIYNSSNVDYGFGSEGGTYYEYSKDDGFRSGYYSYLYGFAENSNSITNDYNNGYTILGFDANSNVVPFIGLTGSLVPYPFYSDAIASNAYLDGTTSSNGFNLIVPQTKTVPDTTRSPPKGYNQTQSQYEQSMPITTTYQAFSSNIQLVDAKMYAFSNISTTSSRIVMDISGFMMTQDSDFRLYNYSTIGSSRQFNYIQTITTDEVFNYNSNIILGAVAANEYEYAFLGLSNGPNYLTDPSDNKIIINTFNPTTKTLETKLITNYFGKFIKPTSVTSFTYNNFGGFTCAITSNNLTGNHFFAIKNSNTRLEFDYTSSNIFKVEGSSSNLYLTNTEASNYVYFTTYQHPKEDLGRFYVSINISNIGYNELYYFNPTILSNTININKKLVAFVSNVNQVNTTAIQFGSGDAFTQLSLTRAPIQDIVYGFKTSAPSSFSQLTKLTPTSLPYDFIQSAVQNTNSIPSQVYEMESGYNGALWFSDLSGNIYGNRYNSIDGITEKLEYAWQIFYHTQRVVYKNISKSVNLLQDLSGLQYAEYYHTQLFYYNNTSNFSNDFSNAPFYSQWGNESNYLISDTHFSGYYFNAYTTIIPLVSNSDYNYLAIRNYSPTEKSQVYLRLSLPNRYDYGYATFTDISNETLYLSTMSQHFNPIYATNLSNFNKNFIFAKRTFGANIVPNYYGVTLSNVSGFGDFMKYYQYYYNTYTSNVTLLNTINNNVNTSLSNFISKDLQYIIPPTAANRQNFTDPLLFSVLWKSELAKQYLVLEDQWGLGWNLGYEKEDTNYDLVHSANSFYKILDDYITLRLNEEFDVNRVDTSGKEKLSATLESTGNTKAYYGKLLLANFGSYAQTMIMNPIMFNPPLGRLDKLTFTFYDRTNTVIDNSDCEWNAIIQVVENSDIVQVERDTPILNPR